MNCCVKKEEHRKKIMIEVGDEALVGTDVELETQDSRPQEVAMPDTDPRTLEEVTEIFQNALQDFDAFLAKRAETASKNASNLGSSKNDFTQLQAQMSGLRQQDFVSTHTAQLETASRIVGVVLQYVSQISLDLRNAQNEQKVATERFASLLDGLDRKGKVDAERQNATFARQMLVEIDQYLVQNDPSVDLVTQLKTSIELLQGIAEYPTDESVEEVHNRVGEIADTIAGIIATYANYASVASQEKQKLQAVLERFAQKTV